MKLYLAVTQVKMNHARPMKIHICSTYKVTATGIDGFRRELESHEGDLHASGSGLHQTLALCMLYFFRTSCNVCSRSKRNLALLLLAQWLSCKSGSPWFESCHCDEHILGRKVRYLIRYCCLRNCKGARRNVEKIDCCYLINTANK